MVLSILNGQETELPDILLKNEAIFKSVVSYQVWQNLSATEKEHLSKYLPSECKESNEGEDSEDNIVKLALGSEKGIDYSLFPQQG